MLATIGNIRNLRHMRRRDPRRAPRQSASSCSQGLSISEEFHPALDFHWSDPRRLRRNSSGHGRVAIFLKIFWSSLPLHFQYRWRASGPCRIAAKRNRKPIYQSEGKGHRWAVREACTSGCPGWPPSWPSSCLACAKLQGRPVWLYHSSTRTVCWVVSSPNV